MTEGSLSPDAKTPDEDNRLISIVGDEAKTNEETPEQQRKSRFSIFRTKPKKEPKFDENETIDCISKGDLNFGFATSLSPSNEPLKASDASGRPS